MSLPPSRPVDKRYRSAGFVSSFACLLVLIFYALLMSLGNYRWIVHEPEGYYEQLTEALLNGQTYFIDPPHPGLARLDNPYAGAQGVPRLHDATYFNGRYYIYFGIAPAAVLSVPWTLLTGTYLTEAACTFVFCSAAFLVISVLWLFTRSRFWPDLSAFWTGCGIVFLGLGNYAVYLFQGIAVYHVASAAAYFFLTSGLFCGTKALFAHDHGSRWKWLVVASLAWGLSVGARPNFLVTLPALAALAVAVLYRKRDETHGGSSGAYVVFAAAVLPAAFVGVGLGYYNWLRFGTPLEFGIKYQFAAMDMRQVKLAGLEYIPSNLSAYFLGPCNHLRYFPFVELPEGVLGIAQWAPLGFACFLLPALCLSRLRQDRDWLLFGGFVFLTTLLNFCGLLVYAFPTERYALDFLTFALFVSLFALASVLRLCKNAAHRIVGILGVAAALYTLVHSVLLTLNWATFQGKLTTVARFFNAPVALVEKMVGTKFGSVRGEIRFTAGVVAAREPLLASANGRDVVFVEYVAANVARFGFFHLGSESPLGQPIEFSPGKVYSIEIDQGALYPPAHHPAFDGVGSGAIRFLRRRISVRLDGKTVYESASAFYPGSPNSFELGSNARASGTTPKFSGALTVRERGGIPRFSAGARTSPTGAVRLNLRFPPYRGTFGEPLVSTGAEGVGDLVYVTYIAPGILRLGLDSARGGAVETRDLRYDPAIDQVIDVEMPSLKSVPAQGPQSASIYFNEQLVLRLDRTFEPTSDEDAVFGFNAARSSAASAAFSGPKLESTVYDASHYRVPRALGWGPIKLTFRLPLGRTSAQEPLLVTGKTGSGDFVFVEYVDPNHIRLGYDHWGVGGIKSDPLWINYHAVNTLEISVGSLYPPKGDAWWREPRRPAQEMLNKVVLKLNDALVIDQSFPAHPSQPETFTPGKNEIGGSSCGPVFTGQLLDVAQPR